MDPAAWISTVRIVPNRVAQRTRRPLGVSSPVGSITISTIQERPPMPAPAHVALIEDYLASLPRLRQIAADLSPDQLRARPVPGKWSTLEVVCHLVDSEQAWCHRMKRVIAEERPLLIGYDESRFTAALPYQENDLEEELTVLEATRHQMARTLRTLPDSAWTRTGVHSERGLITLMEMLRAEVDHVPHHIATIIEKRKALGLPAGG
jgi:uncharacterized damage-inducible protein DinB